MLPVELLWISVTETDVWEYWQRVSYCRYRFSTIVAQCIATLASVAATPRCSAAPFERQLDVRHPWQLHWTGATKPFFRGGVAEYLAQSKVSLTFWGANALALYGMQNAPNLGVVKNEFLEVKKFVRWIQEGFTVEPPRNDSGANFQRNDSGFGPKVRVTGQKSELQTKSQSYSRGDPQNPNRIVQKRNPNGV